MIVKSALLVAAVAAVGGADAWFTPKIGEVTKTEALRSFNSSTLFALHAPGYTNPILVANVSGSTRFEIGYAYGYLLGRETIENMHALFNTVLPNQVLQDLMIGFLSFEYDQHIRPSLPSEFQEEMRGLEAGTAAAGHADAARFAKFGLTLANMATGDVEHDIEYIVVNQFCDFINGIVPGHLCEVDSAATRRERSALAREFAAASKPLFRRMCSMAGVWGNRTQGGQLFSMRNLDWLAQSGISRHKVVLVVHPPEEGRHAHAAIAFAGLYGALAGMSSRGLTVHEAGLDNKEETLDGFAWVLRLRYLMETAGTLAEARAQWAATKNTVGMNHGLGSGADGAMLVAETKRGYTAFFGDDDAREAGNALGAPLREAVWRTNHAYDPEIIRTGLGIAPHHGDSLTRYMLLHDTIAQYAADGVPMDVLQAVNITAVVGDKGGSSVPSFVSCDNAANGANILSVTFQPRASTVYLAFEDGVGSSFVPGACNYYVRLDLSPYFGSQ